MMHQAIIRQSPPLKKKDTNNAYKVSMDMDPREIYFVMAISVIVKMKQINAGTGKQKSMTPQLLATPLPPFI